MAIVGAGAAGSACAWSLAQHPHKFSVVVFDANPRAGGVAYSVALPDGRVINEGVQGGAPSYRNTLQLLSRLGLEVRPVNMTVSFGRDEHHWSNTADSPLLQRLRDDIARFARVLRLISRLEPLSIAVPIRALLRLCCFSAAFTDHVLFPLIALFFGTGGQTPHVSAAVVARVFHDPQLRLFDYDPQRLLSQSPDMFAFPPLSAVYDALVSSTAASGNVEWRFSSPVSAVQRQRDRVLVNGEPFDEVVLACDAETALRLLDTPSWAERSCLSNVHYFDDVTVTHTDEAYMRRHYELGRGSGSSDGGFMYFIRTDPDDATRTEMSFDLRNYQSGLKGGPAVYQSIFLDKASRHHWTERELDAGQVLRRTWWRQFAHTWRHFVTVVPLVRFIQGRRRSWFCGSWTAINTHEMAVVSGLVVADRLGAPYPFTHDELARSQFELYRDKVHGLAPICGRSAGRAIAIACALLVVLGALLMRASTGWAA